MRSFIVFFFLLAGLSSGKGQVGTTINYEDGLGPLTLAYNGVVNGKHSYLGPDMIAVQWSNTRWEISCCGGNTILYISNEETAMNPPNFSIGNWQNENNGGVALMGLSGSGTSAIVLPVNFLGFKGVVGNENVQLLWQTASEEDNAGFEVQRSTDGQRFETLTFIEGKGNSQVIQNYLYDDKALRQNQTYYYRLKQIDYSGEFSYSDIVAVKLAGKESTLGNFYPNPSAGHVQMKYTAPQAEDLLLTVYTNTGQEVLSLKRHAEAGTSLLSFDVSSLQSGHYFVKLQNGDTTNYQELVIE